jgi:hypothetical protein
MLQTSCRNGGIHARYHNITLNRTLRLSAFCVLALPRPVLGPSWHLGGGCTHADAPIREPGLSREPVHHLHGRHEGGA